MSLLTALHTAKTGLRVASTGIAVTSHNVTNASTEGYTRRTLRTRVTDPIRRGTVVLGTGARAIGMDRSWSRFVDERLVAAWGGQARSGAALERLSAVEAVFDESGTTDVATAYEAFFDALEELAADPSDDALRLEAASAADSFAAAVRRTDEALSDEMDGIYDELSDSLDEIQSQLDELARMNEAIAEAGGELGGGDYADRAYQLASSLAESIGAQAVFSSDGQVTLFIGGHAAVSGSTARTLSIERDADGSPKLTLSVDGATVDVTSDLGGEAGGLLDAWSTASELRDDLDSFAAAFADAFNAQHAAGYDADGNAGIAEPFTYGSDSPAASFEFDSSILDDPGMLALAGSATGGAGDGDNLSALLELHDTDLVDGKTGTELLAAIYSKAGSAVASAQADAEAYGAVVSDLEDLRTAISGVDLDEEATELIAWQTAYQAAARVVSAADELLGELMDMAR